MAPDGPPCAMASPRRCWSPAERLLRAGGDHEGRFVEDRAPQHVGAPQREVGQDDPAGAVPVDHGRGEAERLQQRGGVVGLLVHRAPSVQFSGRGLRELPRRS